MQHQLKQLGLTQLEQALPTLFETARQEQWTYEQFLTRAVGAEIEGRDRRAAERRMTAAHLPTFKTLEAFDFSDSSQPFRAIALGAGRSFLCTNLDKYCLSRTSWNGENALVDCS
jgi:DNA replication protein DnaC